MPRVLISVIQRIVFGSKAKVVSSFELVMYGFPHICL